MQSDGNTFCGDIFLDSVNMVSRDEDSLLEKANMLGILFYDDLNF